MLKTLSESQLRVFNLYKNYLSKEQKAPTYQVIGEKLKIKPSAVYKHVNNLVNLGYLYKDNAGKISLQSLEQSKKIPILGEIACGNPLTIFEELNEYIEIPNSMIKGNENYYALRAKGDSMEGKGIYDGDFLIIRQQNDVNDGEIGVIIEKDDFEEYATLKTVYHKKSGILAKPSNNRFNNIFIENKNVAIRGKLTGIIKLF